MSSGATPLFVVRSLVRRPWIDGFDLSLFPGEIAVLRGPSGSGKSLLLRTIADLDPAEEGTLSLDGRERSTFAPAEWRRRVLYVHPAGARLQGTVEGNLERVLSLEAHAGRSASVPEGLDPAGPAEQLSSGEGERLALTRALACEPPVLLLDEATAHLDALRSRACEEQVLAYVAEGRAALWAAHDAGLAERLGARVVTLAGQGAES